MKFRAPKNATLHRQPFQPLTRLPPLDCRFKQNDSCISQHMPPFAGNTQSLARPNTFYKTLRNEVGTVANRLVGRKDLRDTASRETAFDHRVLQKAAQRGGGAILLHFCGSPDPSFLQQNEPFYLKTCTPVKAPP